MENYISYLKASFKSENTIIGYQSDMSFWGKVAERNSIEIYDLKVGTIEKALFRFYVVSVKRGKRCFRPVEE